jgi:aryl-alcohol dehydrogenase-like predicted oxidoreductase
MRTLILGRGLEVSAQGLGCMGMSEFYGPTDETESLATLELASELGVNLYDTSDTYGDGANERLLGKFIHIGNRHRILIATKFGFVREVGRRVIRGDPIHVKEACDASLRRLGTDSIDLYYLHRPDPKVPIEVTVGAMSELVDAGKVKHLGLSNITAQQLRRGFAVHPITAVQCEWSLFTRDAEAELLPVCRELGVGVVAYAPLCRGFLTGMYNSRAQLAADDFRQVAPRFGDDNAKHNERLLEFIKRIAVNRGLTLAQVALAWVHQRVEAWRVPVVPIPGTKHPNLLKENIAATEVHLTDAELDSLESIGGQVAGGAWPGG